ncbi:glutathione hydrolase 1 proenzyme isoform X2 [Calliphora vicina]
MGLSNNDDAMNKIPLKSVTDDDEKNGGEFIHDTATAEEARREQRRVKLLNLMKKLTIGIICFIGIALISYVIISLCFSEWPKSTSTNPLKYLDNKHFNTTTTTTTTTTPIITTTSTTTSNTATIITPSNNPPQPLPPSASPIQSLPSTFKSSFLSDDNNTTTTSATSANNTLTNSTLHAASIVGTTQADTDAAAAAAAADDIATLNVTQPTDVASATGNDAVTKASIDATATLATPTTTTKTEVPLLRDIPILEENFTSTLGVFQHAAVCSDKPLCSKIGSQILQDGGSAVDAAIASLLCVGITTLQSMGIGGGMLMNIYVKSHKQAFSVDAREVAPFAATQDMFEDDIKLSLHGGLSIAVPGELMGYDKAHSKFGKLPWKKLVEPSLKLCKEGFYMTKHLNAAYTSKFNRTISNEILSKVFVNETTQKIHPVGTKLYPLPELCNTYELLATKGARDFYNGTLGRLVAADLKDLGSLVTYDDLESYGADMVSSVTMQLGDDILHAIPPISSGTIVANVLSILEGFNFTQADLLDTEHRATAIHRIVEALKFGYAKRWELGDVRYNDVRDLVSRLTNPETGIQLRKLINDSTVLNNVHEYGAQFSEEDDIGTSPLVVMAANGDAVAVTSTINDYFGSGQVGKRTGIIFNSAMNDFSTPGHKNNFNLPPSPSNFIGPQKRPMSSMSPMILTDPKGNVRLAVSAAGGAKIISAIVDVMSRVLWFNQNIKEAIDAPRFHSQLVPNVLEYEQSSFFSEEILKLLADKGHVLKASTAPGSVLCGIVKNSTAIYANADYRKQGGIAGY